MVPEMSSIAIVVVEGLLASSHLPYMTIAVPADKYKCASTVARSSKKRCLNSADATATVVEKRKERVGCHERCGVVAYTTRGSGFLESIATSNGGGMLRLH